MKRGQRKRTKGWRKPQNSRYVGRGTKWGNPFKVIKTTDGDYTVILVNGEYRVHPYDFFEYDDALNACIVAYHNYAKHKLNKDAHWLDELREYDTLLCWCALDQPCHVDVLIELLDADIQRENSKGE